MNPNTFPTKGNLIICKNSLKLAVQGYALMDKKRNILIRELSGLIEEAKDIQSDINETYTEAYKALQKANIELGISRVEEISNTIPVDDSIKLKYRSIMGTDIPLVESEKRQIKASYTFYETRESLDQARVYFEKVKELTIKLSMVENSAYRLAANIRKTQKRANALKNITIPAYTKLVKDISNALEEKDREEFTRLKVIKRQKEGEKY
ncbi:MAG: V-type ATP synthase subunit D [Eubacteriales bacterium]|nr:V-type ATP synthase subunit D [Eubacteriales bacterium]